MRIFKVWLLTSSASSPLALHLPSVLQSFFFIPPSFVLPQSLSQIDPSERSPEHSSPLSSPHPHNPTSLPFTMSSAHIPLRMKQSFGLSQWNWKCPNHVTTTCCVFGAPSSCRCHYPTRLPERALGIQGCQVKELAQLQSVVLPDKKRRHYFPIAFHKGHLARTPWDKHSLLVASTRQIRNKNPWHTVATPKPFPLQWSHSEMDITSSSLRLRDGHMMGRVTKQISDPPQRVTLSVGVVSPGVSGF